MTAQTHLLWEHGRLEGLSLNGNGWEILEGMDYPLDSAEIPPLPSDLKPQVTLTLDDRLVTQVPLEIEDWPRRKKERSEMVRWQLKRRLPYAVEEARIRFSWILEPHKRLWVIAISDSILGPWEKEVKQRGCQLGLVQPVSLGLADRWLDQPGSGTGDTLFILVGFNEVVFLLLRGQDPILWRLKDLSHLSEEKKESFLTREAALTGAFLREKLGGVGLQNIFVRWRREPCEIQWPHGWDSVMRDVSTLAPPTVGSDLAPCLGPE